MIEILEKSVDYLKKTIPDFKKNRDIFTCPICQNKEMSCSFIPNSFNMDCFICSADIGDIIDVEAKKNNINREQASIKIRDLLKIKVNTNGEVNDILDIYEQNKFDLVPVARNAKNPIEKDWTNKTHTNKKEWLSWIERDLNIGVKTGKCSNITVIDFDTLEIPKEISELLPKTFTQKTRRGTHYFFKYIEFPKTGFDYKGHHIDIENDGGQVVVSPSTVDGIGRTITNHPIVEMPKELVEFLKGIVKTKPTIEKQELPKMDLGDLSPIKDGNRTNTLMAIGGMLRKQLNTNQSKYVLSILNQNFCNPNLDYREFSEVIRSINKYDDFDEKELGRTILDYLIVVEEATATDIKDALGFNKGKETERMNKTLSYLIREGFLIKKRRMYHVIKKAEWKEEFVDMGLEIDYDFPFFGNSAVIRNGDMIVIGGRTGTGKSHIAMNMIKMIIEQDKGIVPYYVSLESGNRFSQIAVELGLKESDFKWCVHFSPENIELEDNAVTFIDWLLPADYATTDKLYERFSQQLNKHGGVLVIFTQLRGNQEGSFFAEDMVQFFPAVVAKFLYEKDANGDYNHQKSYFELNKVRESRGRKFVGMKIPCEYDWKNKRLNEVK